MPQIDRQICIYVHIHTHIQVGLWWYKSLQQNKITPTSVNYKPCSKSSPVCRGVNPHATWACTPFFFFPWPWDLSSPSRNWALAPTKEAQTPHHWQVREVPLTLLEQKFSSTGEHKDFPGTCTTQTPGSHTKPPIPTDSKDLVFTRNLNKEPRQLVSSREGLRKDEWHTLWGTSKMPIGEFDSSVFRLVFLGMQKLFFAVCFPGKF